MVTKKKDKADFRRNVLRQPKNDGPDLAELQEADFRKLCDSRQEAAKKNEKKDSDNDGDKSGSK